MSLAIQQIIRRAFGPIRFINSYFINSTGFCNKWGASRNSEDVLLQLLFVVVAVGPPAVCFRISIFLAAVPKPY